MTNIEEIKDKRITYEKKILELIEELEKDIAALEYKVESVVAIRSTKTGSSLGSPSTMECHIKLVPMEDVNI